MTTIPIPTSIPRAPAMRTQLTGCQISDDPFFHLTNDGDYADVIFLYPSEADVTGFHVHTIIENGNRRIINCRDKDCPYCESNDPKYKIFAPIYNITLDTVQFWERTGRWSDLFPNMFLNQLIHLWKQYPNLTDVVVRITRHGKPYDKATYYELQPIGRRTQIGIISYKKILKKFNISFPEHYKTIIEDLDFTPEPEKLEVDIKTPYTALICKGCGAAIDPISKHCNFCGTAYIW